MASLLVNISAYSVGLLRDKRTSDPLETINISANSKLSRLDVNLCMNSQKKMQKGGDFKLV